MLAPMPVYIVRAHQGLGAKGLGAVGRCILKNVHSLHKNIAPYCILDMIFRVDMTI